MIAKHEPVLLEEVIKSLQIKKFGKYIDATLGAGGYTKAILEKGGEVLGIDMDENMIKIARDSIGDNVSRMTFVLGNFRNIKKIAEENGFTNVDGIVFDLGVSNVHFMDEERGFSFRNPEAALDMRLDSTTNSIKASDLLNALREDQLKEMFGRNLAEKIVEFRKTRKFESVGDFLSLFPEKKVSDRVHPATKAFLSLRTTVNSELDNLREALPQAYELLKPGGRLAVVSFNSDEDRIAKNFGMSELIRPSEEEIERNPKSRSAILRVILKNAKN